MARKNLLTTSEHFDYPEFERFLGCLRKDGYYVWEIYARLSFCTASRISDVLSFRWKDVLHQDQVTLVEKKTGKTQVRMINSSVRKCISELYNLMGRPDTESYICSTNRSEQFSPQYINRKLKFFKHKYRLDIGNFSSHTFRKTFGRYVYEKNDRSAESLMLLNKILRHSHIETTKAYIGITQGEINSLFASIQF